MVKFIILTWLTFAQVAPSPKVQQFLQEHQELAKVTECSCRIPKSVVLAQAAMESNFGNSKLAKENNNFFGIRKNEFSNEFKKYDNIYDCYIDYCKLMHKEFSNAFQYPITDYTNWCLALDNSVDKGLAIKMIRTIQRYEWFK